MHTSDGQRYRNETLPLEGQIALVTGVRNGIGSAMALTFAEAGADVAVCDLVVEDGEMEGVAEEIRKLGRRCLAVQTDVTKRAQVEELVGRTEDDLGPIDLLANTVGGGKYVAPGPDRYTGEGLPPRGRHFPPAGPNLLDYREADWDAIMDLNLKSCFFCCQVVAERMVERRKGNIITVSSEMGLGPPPGLPVYHVAKAGVIMLTKMFAHQLAPFKIRVNTIAPGATATMHGWYRGNEEILEPMRRRQPLYQIATPSDMAAAALFLATDGARFITGETILPDGGLSLG